MRGEEALRRIATQALDATKADEAEVVLSANESALTRFANSTIHQNVFEAGIEVRVRAVLGTRIGVATTTRTDERSLREAAERAVESARYVPENPEFQGLPAPEPITPVSAYSSATASYSAERRAREAPLGLDALPILPEQRHQPPGSGDRAVRRLANPLQEEAEPRLPVPVTPHDIEQPIVLVAGAA